MHLSQKCSYMCGEMWDDLQMQLDEVLATCAVVTVSGQFVGKCASFCLK